MTSLASRRSALDIVLEWAASFQHRDFRVLWASTLLQSLGMGMEQVVVGWLVFEMTGSPFLVGLASALRMAPFFFLGLVSGAVADRVDRRLSLRFVTVGGGLSWVVMVLVLLTGAAEVWHVMALAAASGAVWVFIMTVRPSYTYDIVESDQALNGISLNAISTQVGLVFGALVAGAIISSVGAGGQSLVIGLMYFASFGVLLFTRTIPTVELIQRESLARNFVGYVRIIRHNRILMTLMSLAAIIEVLGFTHMSLLPVIAKDVLGLGALGLGVMTAVRQFGAIAGLLILARVGKYRRNGLLMFGLVIAFGGGLMSLSLSTNFIYFIAILTLVNACAMSIEVLFKTLMQANVSEEQRGRAMGAWALSIGVAPVGHMGVGALAGMMGAPMTLLVNGGLLLVAGLTAAASLPGIRRLP